MNISNLIEKLPEKEQKYFIYLIKDLKDEEKERFIREVYELSEVEQDLILKMLLRMSPEQITGIIYNSNDEGPLMILGDEISMKRTLLANRIAYHLITRNIKVDEVLGLCFSNLNAGSIIDMIGNSLPEKMIFRMDIDTFNSISLQILRDYVLGSLNIEKIGYKTSPKFRVLVAREQLLLLKRALEESKIPSSELGFSQLVGSIIGLKRELVSPEDAVKQAKDDEAVKVAKVYTIYQDLLIKNNTCDINDLVRLTIQLFNTSSEVLEYYRGKYKMIFIDDYHYSSFAQYQMIKVLTEGKKNLTFTSGHKINTYKWSANAVNYSNDFGKDFKGKTVEYDRSAIDVEEILKREIFIKTGESVEEIEPAETADFNEYIEGEALIRLEEEDEVNESSLVINSIIRKTQEGTPFGKIAIVVRTNRQIEVLKKVLKGANIPFFITGDRLLARDEINDVMSLLKTVYYVSEMNSKKKLTPDELHDLNESLKAIFLNIIPLQLEFNTYVQLEKMALEAQTDIYSILLDDEKETDRFKTRFPLKDREIVGFFKDLIQTVSKEIEEFDVAILIELLTNETKFLDSLVAEGKTIGRIKAENIKYLYLYATEFMKNNSKKGKAGLKDFVMDIVAKKKKQDEELKLHEDDVKVITLNAIEDISYQIYYLI
ncbi:UvrD-helicase domain-containing protein [bacterium]|nr:UvrD-helicase domain-containing protein [bacterium]